MPSLPITYSPSDGKWSISPDIEWLHKIKLSKDIYIKLSNTTEFKASSSNYEISPQIITIPISQLNYYQVVPLEKQYK